MGKLVILGGNARSGKTTLAFKLVKKGFSRSGKWKKSVIQEI